MAFRFPRRFSIFFSFLLLCLFGLGSIPASPDDRTATEMILESLRIKQLASLEEGQWNLKDEDWNIEWNVEVASGDISFTTSDPDARERASFETSSGEESPSSKVSNYGLWQPLTVGVKLGLSSRVKSGNDGFALLSNKEGTIAIAANTRMALPAKRDKAGTRILQTIGNMLFRVTKRPNRHFIVETPYLIAGVKGTTFGISVDKKSASVSVSEGRVGVSETAGGNESSVSAGQTASAGSQPGGGVDVQATGPKGASLGQQGKSSVAMGKTGAPSGKSGKSNSSAGNGGGNSGGGNSGGGNSGGGNSGGGNSGGGNSGGGNSGGGNGGGNSGKSK